MRCRDALVAVLALALVGCSSATHGNATVWITRDRGAQVLLVRHVPAGLTAMQGLERVAHVQTRYAGRFVQGINGISGSLARQHDWFYFVNGYEADRSASEYRLHPGDVEWWDFRSWRGSMSVPVVVGAFPEPFMHGWDGHRRQTVVVAPRGLIAGARAIAAAVHGRLVIAKNVYVQRGVNAIFVVRGSASVRAEGGRQPGAPVTFVVRARRNPLAVLRAARFRYSMP
jgi:Domain of unknown function (DUF4430)